MANALVLFVCTTNLIRSPYAASKLAALGGEFTTFSAGSYCGAAAREVPLSFRQSALSRGVDLSAHRSLELASVLLGRPNYDLVITVVMDEDSYDFLTVVEPQPNPPERFVQYLKDLSYTSISEPSLEKQEIEQTLDVIDRGIGLLVERLRLQI